MLQLLEFLHLGVGFELNGERVSAQLFVFFFFLIIHPVKPLLRTAGGHQVILPDTSPIVPALKLSV